MWWLHLLLTPEALLLDVFFFSFSALLRSAPSCNRGKQVGILPVRGVTLVLVGGGMVVTLEPSFGNIWARLPFMAATHLTKCLCRCSLYLQGHPHNRQADRLAGPQWEPPT